MVPAVLVVTPAATLEAVDGAPGEATLKVVTLLLSKVMATGAIGESLMLDRNLVAAGVSGQLLPLLLHHPQSPRQLLQHHLL